MPEPLPSKYTDLTGTVWLSIVSIEGVGRRVDDGLQWFPGKAPQGCVPSFTQRAPFCPELDKPHFQTAGQTSLGVCVSFGFHDTEFSNPFRRTLRSSCQGWPQQPTGLVESPLLETSKTFTTSPALLPPFAPCCHGMPWCVASHSTTAIGHTACQDSPHWRWTCESVPMLVATWPLRARGRVRTFSVHVYSPPSKQLLSNSCLNSHSELNASSVGTARH